MNKSYRILNKEISQANIEPSPNKVSFTMEIKQKNFL